MSQPLAQPAGARSTASILVETLFVLAASTALAVWLTWPLATDLDGSIYGLPGDSTGAISLLSWFADKIGYHVVGTTHISFTGAPFGWEFSNGLNVQWGALFGPGMLVTKVFGEVVAYNLIVLSGLALSAASMYLLVRTLGVPPPVAAWAGLVYTIFPWHLEKAGGHAGFVHLEGFPLLLLAVLAWYRRPTFARALLIGGASLLLWTTAGYFGVLGAVSLAVLLLVVALFHSRTLGARRAIGRLGLAGSAVIVVSLLVYAPTAIGAGSGVGSQRSPGELSTYGARLWEYVLPSYRNRFFGDDVGNWLFAHLHGSNFTETSLYVGWLTILLAGGWLVWALVHRVRLTPSQRYLAIALPVLVLAAGLFSLPSPLPGTNVPTPARVLWELAPQFRVPSRFIAVVMTGLVCLAALGLSAVCSAVARAVPRPALSRLAVVAVCGIAAAVSLIELPIEASPATTKVSAVPPYYSFVRSAQPGILVEYPLVKADQGAHSDYLFWQRKHGRSILNGAQLETFPDSVGQALVDPASPEAASALAALGVAAVVVRPNTYVPTGGPTGYPQLKSGYRFLGGADGVNVWGVVAAPAPAIATFRTGFGLSETPAGIRTSRWLNAPSGTVDLEVFRPGTYLARFQINSYARPRLVRIRGRRGFQLFSVSGVRTVEVPLRLRRGRSHLTLETRPGTELIPDGRQVSVYVSNWRFVTPRGRKGGVPLEPFTGGAP
jgi:hypothetical protein